MKSRNQRPDPLNIALADFGVMMFQNVGRYERAIRERIPLNMPIRARGPIRVILPSEARYANARRAFTKEVCSPAAIYTLVSLFCFRIYEYEEFDGFWTRYGDTLGRKRKLLIKKFFPSLDQTTICKILDDIGRGTITNRIDDLNQIGLVRIEPLGAPPMPKFVSISDAGMEAIIEAGLSGLRSMAQLFSPTSSLAPMVAPPQAAPSQSANRVVGVRRGS